MTDGGGPGALIDLDGTMNLRDLGGWSTASGQAVIRGQVYRSDRLSLLSETDLARLAAMGIGTVIDLRYEAEVAVHPSRLWTTVTRHVAIPMGGQLADQRSFVDQILAGEVDQVTEDDVGASYLDLLQDHATGFGQALEVLLDSGPSLFHCTAGKDRTGLLAMLVLSTVGVADRDVLHDFSLSNQYRAERRMTELRPVFEERGLDIERFRPALSAPPPALATALAWLREMFGSVGSYLEGPAGVPGATRRLRSRLLPAP
jgi:protein-tyrosine phosphatase